MSQDPRADRLLTVVEIKALIVRERYYRDTQQWEKLRSCYHSDASQTNINITWYHGDAQGFVTESEAMAARSFASSMHVISPVEVHLNGRRAVSESTASIHARFCYEQKEFVCISYGRLVSRLEKEGADWKICTLEMIYDNDILQAVYPEKEHVKAIQLDNNARRSYRCLSWVLAQNGFSINQDLPGADRPGSGDRLLRLSFEWLGDLPDEEISRRHL